MSYILLLVLSAFIANSSVESSFEIARVKERLENSANQLTITELSNPPKPTTYLNSQLTKNAPHQVDLTSELTSIIPEWNPQVFTLDPACPYYFSKLNVDDLNLLSYLHAIESNETVSAPFVNVLPQSYRGTFPLLSIFRCRELVQPSSSPFFHNIELILGLGKTELPLHRLSTEFSQFFCSLYGSPHFLLINQTKSPTMTYNAPTLLSQENLTDIDFLLTSLTPGSCLFVPSDWVIGAQLNNSISLVFTLKTITSPPDGEFLRCTKTGSAVLEEIRFTIEDPFNITALSLIAYFYPHLNPPMFDREFTSETFLRYFQADKNVSQLIMKWTPELTDLIQNKLFQHLDVNDDELFSIGDYFSIKQSNVKALEQSISGILEEIRRTVHTQYNELSEMTRKIIQQSGTDGLDDEDKGTLLAMLENLPEAVKKNLGRNNINVKDVLDKIRSVKSKQPSNKKQRRRENEEFDRTDL